MEPAIERFVALAFVITGASHIAAPRAWAHFFALVRSTGPAAGLISALVHSPTGLLIVAFHPVWHGTKMFITLIGCGLVLKGTLHSISPALADRSMALATEKHAGRFRIVGAVAVMVGLAAGWMSLT